MNLNRLNKLGALIKKLLTSNETIKEFLGESYTTNFPFLINYRPYLIFKGKYGQITVYLVNHPSLRKKIYTFTVSNQFWSINKRENCFRLWELIADIERATEVIRQV